MPHQTRDVRRFAERGIAHDVEVGETGDAESFADPVAAGTFWETRIRAGRLLTADYSVIIFRL